MPGASEQTSQFKVLNANWTVGQSGTDGQFEIMIVTAAGKQHTPVPSQAAMTTLLDLAKADTI